ncbi:MAG: hypothetical protein ACREI9_02225 [Nitrospiraceae bacterium]
MSNSVLRVLLILLIMLCGAPEQAQADNYTFTPIDVADAYSTVAFGINASGQIVGGYTDTTGVNHGYLYTMGSFTVIDVPGAGLTAAFGINNRGQIVGYYFDGATGREHGFLANPVPEP